MNADASCVLCYGYREKASQTGSGPSKSGPAQPLLVSDYMVQRSICVYPIDLGAIHHNSQMQRPFQHMEELALYALILFFDAKHMADHPARQNSTRATGARHWDLDVGMKVWPWESLTKRL